MGERREDEMNIKIEILWNFFFMNSWDWGYKFSIKDISIESGWFRTKFCYS